jgi:hypothetical protein
VSRNIIPVECVSGGKRLHFGLARDLEDSNQIQLEDRKKRGLGERMKEWVTRLFRYWL